MEGNGSQTGKTEGKRVGSWIKSVGRKIEGKRWIKRRAKDIKRKKTRSWDKNLWKEIRRRKKRRARSENARRLHF